MTRLSATKARETFSDVINRVNYQGERIVLERHGKGVVALIPVTDLHLLEELEDRIDLALARERRAERGRIPWEKVKERLGLGDAAVPDRSSSERRGRAPKATGRRPSANRKTHR